MRSILSPSVEVVLVVVVVGGAAGRGGGRGGGDMDCVRSILFGFVEVEVLAVGARGEGGGGDSVRSMWGGLGLVLFEGGPLVIVASSVDFFVCLRF